MTQISVKHSYNEPVESVFDAFLNVKSSQNFMFRTDTGILVEAVNEGASVGTGGTFLFSEKRGGMLAEHFGTFVEIEKNEKISFVFGVERGAEQSSYVELHFRKTQSGCEVELQNEIKPEYLEMKAKITQGWTGILARLESFLARAVAPAGVLQPKDSNGQLLNEGDSVKTIKDLKVKGSSMVVKRGTVVKKVHLISGNDEEVDCKVDGVALSLETQWLVKV